MNDAIFSQIDFGPLKEFIDIDDITDISYTNGGQLWLKSLSKGVYRVERPEINNALIEKLAFQTNFVFIFFFRPDLCISQGRGYIVPGKSIV